ncbi:alpha/beta fold hydrolase [Clavibacter michiganensis]|uniref:Hydrolase n=1 Tax=Clavibacter michiganensis subsp. michiganensis (strain NCPPB 382) TaxID=443906 RepID=A5CQB3_CLAM3|nr:alpha/beta hydrolase [Clavibacter michiganensis]CAN01266.1 putative hydrolase [Clavibacter michiganensis subsp. michiganensis NCPPB 382]
MRDGLLGRDVTVTTPDGRRLRAMVAGARDDLVVLEAGLGGSGLTWGLVHGILARTHRVVAYDRAGLGDSDTDPAPRDLDRLADDLEAVIAAFPHRRLVLAGHSWGGQVVRVVAARRIARGLATAGVVLVDPSDERARGYGSAAARIGFATQAALVVPLARLGLLRRLHRMALAGLPEPLLAAAADAAGSVRAARATAAEQRHLLPGLADIAGILGSAAALPGIPVRVISGTTVGPLTRGQRRDLVRAHRSSAAAFEQGAWIPAPRSEHMVPITDPDVVAAAITGLL